MSAPRRGSSAPARTESERCWQLYVLTGLARTGAIYLLLFQPFRIIEGADPLPNLGLVEKNVVPDVRCECVKRLSNRDGRAWR